MLGKGKSLKCYVNISGDAESTLIAGARDIEPVRGLTHNFYRYPARFSPVFVRSVIEALSAPGDMVLDPYAGGGTTLVEAVAAGRDVVGVDINALAEFVSTVKTTIYSEPDLAILETWANALPMFINMKRQSTPFREYIDRGYYKHLDHSERWRIRKAVEQALESALLLPSHLEGFGRCLILRTAQIALDGRRTNLSLSKLRDLLRKHSVDMISGARMLREAKKKHSTDPKVTILNRSAVGIENDERIANFRSPRLIVTSPPYPGLHVLYHRWQVGGGRETAAPYWIANKLDGAGISYYTMGGRKAVEYFAKIRATTESVAKLCDNNTIIVQMLAFARPETQLPQYLDAMAAAGLTEMFLPSLIGEHGGRLWRSVPNRKWYSEQRGETPGSKEVVLFHRLKREALTSSMERERRSPVAPGLEMEMQPI